MAKNGYQGVTLKQDVADRLESHRKARGLKTIPETISQLMDEVSA